MRALARAPKLLISELELRNHFFTLLHHLFGWPCGLPLNSLSQATCKHAWPALCSTTPTSATTGSKGTASSMGCGTSHMSSAYCSFLRSPSAKPANVVTFRAHHTLKPTTHRSATLLAVVATVAPWHEAEASRGHAARPHPTCCQVARTCPARCNDAPGQHTRNCAVGLTANFFLCSAQ